MLTVLHRHNDGTETIYEAKSVSRECINGPTIPPCGDIIINGVTDTDEGPIFFAGPGSCSEANGRVRISPKWMDPKGFDETRVFVMNRFGATVAQHRIFLKVGD